MFTGVLRAGLPALLAGTIGLPMAHADIFTWVDASGTINVSNLVPPDGVRVTNVIHENAPQGAARDAELQALAARVRQLEDEVAAAKPQAPQVVYQGMPPPPAMQYAGDWAPPPTPYAYAAAPPASVGCDPTWMNCGLWWGPGIFPASVVVPRAPKSRRFFPVRVEHHIAAHRPAGPPRGVHRG
jgi:hypothetical protein